MRQTMIIWIKNHYKPKNLLILFLVFSFLLVRPHTSHAVNDDAKAVLGGMLGAFIVEGIKEVNKQEPQQQQQQQQNINWKNTTQQHTPSKNNTNSPEALKEKERNKKIQKLLSKIEFYNGSFDGIAGAGTQSAIKDWEIEFDQIVDEKISDKEMILLKDTSEKNFNNKIEYKISEAQGFSNREEYAAAKSSKVQIFLTDIDAFLKTYEDDIDFKMLATNLKMLQKTKHGKWEQEYQTFLNELKDYFYDLDGFNDFQKEQEQQRVVDTAENIKKMLSEIKNIYAFSDHYLKNNIMDERSITLSEALQKLAFNEASELKEKELSELLNEAKTQIQKAGLSMKFSSWEREKEQENNSESDSKNIK
ncbi:MAG: peptidoglycan-binding protein [Alphaproteobacteria bacterium]|nr:peptidoglycan-binding protein [Alphaproteobacteria bacterium]